MDVFPPIVSLVLAMLGAAYGAFWLSVVLAVLAYRARDRLLPSRR